jgi:hypothetical protein
MVGWWHGSRFARAVGLLTASRSLCGLVGAEVERQLLPGLSIELRRTGTWCHACPTASIR